jgi:hypothetical protein
MPCSNGSLAFVSKPESKHATFCTSAVSLTKFGLRTVAPKSEVGTTAMGKFHGNIPIG